MPRLKNYILLLILLLTATSCNGKNASKNKSSADGFKVVSTTAQIGDLVSNIVGEKGKSEALLGEGVDPHLYKLTRRDIGKLTNADAIFYNGLFLEGKMIDSLERIRSSGKPVVAVTSLIDRQYLVEPPEYEGQYDPHIWMDARAWRRVALRTQEKLTHLYPQHKEAFEKNGEEYLEELNQLHNYAKKVLSTVPKEKRVLVTAHDAFNYFGRAYNFKVVGIQGISTDSEAGLHRIETIVDLLVKRKLPAIFIETTISRRNIKALIEGAAADGHEVKIGGELFSDAMGAPGSYTGTYVGMIDHNVSTITKALGGQIPPGGMQGKLEHLK